MIAPTPAGTPRERALAFVAEYMQLVRKYSVRLDSCGCCASPFFVFDDPDEWEAHESHLRSDAPDEDPGDGLKP